MDSISTPSQPSLNSTNDLSDPTPEPATGKWGNRTVRAILAGISFLAGIGAIAAGGVGIFSLPVAIVSGAVCFLAGAYVILSSKESSINITVPPGWQAPTFKPVNEVKCCWDYAKFEPKMLEIKSLIDNFNDFSTDLKSKINMKDKELLEALVGRLTKEFQQKCDPLSRDNAEKITDYEVKGLQGLLLYLWTILYMIQNMMDSCPDGTKERVDRLQAEQKKLDLSIEEWMSSVPATPASAG